MIRKQVFNLIGYVLIFLGASMLFSAGWSIYYNESDLWAILKSSLITIVFGGVLRAITYSKKKKEFTSRDGFAIVTLGWLLMAAFSALPFYFSELTHLSYTNAYFEAMSGLTTTGASVLGHSSTYLIEDLSYGLLFWRSFTHFIGGMGIIVFSIAILPLLGIGGVQLFRAEVAGPVADKMTPRVKQTATLLWGIYVGLISAETIILMAEGLTFFDSICHAFGTMATGGFSTKNASVGEFGSLVQWTIILFMFLAATNFSLHYFAFVKRKYEYVKDKEFRVYLTLFCFFAILFFINISSSDRYNWDFDSLRHAVFSSIALITTTGFGTENFNEWPALSKTIVFFLLFIGGSAGSTTGGMKIIRLIVVVKYLITEVKKLLHPTGYYTIHVNEENKPVSDEVVKNTLGFYLFYILIFAASALVFSMFGLDMITSLTASASAIGNIGPGLGSIGPWDNWGHFPDLAKWMSSFLMLLGRLEIFTVIVLFSRSFWKK